MADATDPTTGLPDLQSLLGSMVSQIPQNMKDTQSQMGALQDYIKNQQSSQLNIPALQFAAGLLKPTRTGSFAESVGNAGEGALGSLQKQREIDLDRQAKILELQQAKGSLLNQQVQTLMPLALQQSARAAWNGDQNATPLGSAGGGDAGGTGPIPSPPLSAPSSGGAAGAAGAPGIVGAAAAADPVQIQLQHHQGMMAYYARMGNAQGVEAEARAITALTGTSPSLAGAIAGAKTGAENAAQLRYAGAIAGAKTGAERSAGAPYELVDIKLPDGSTAKVPLSSIVHGGTGVASAPQGNSSAITPSPVAPVVAGDNSALPPGSIKSGPNHVDVTENEMADTIAKKVPDQIESLALQRQQLEAMGHVYETYQPGALAEQKADIAANLRAVGINLKDTDTMNPAAFQQATKYGISEIFNQVKAMGGQPRVAEISGLSKAMAMPDIQPGAVKAVTSQLLGVVDWKNAMLHDYATEYGAGKVKHPEEWTDSWAAAHPVGQFVTERLKNTPVLGVPPMQVPNGGLGIADKDYADPNGNVTIHKGEKFVKFDQGHIVPIDRVGDYYKWKADN